MNSEGTEPGHSRTGTAAHDGPPTESDGPPTADDKPSRQDGANGAGIVLGGRYRLGERLGQGGMSTVFQAHDQSLGREVAVKLFRSDVADKTELHRQRGEVRVLAGLNHPNLVMVYDAVTDKDSLEARTYLVMELVRGTDLHRARQRADLGNDDDGIGPDQIARMGAGLSDALAYIHERGIVHRDVKPANILVGDGTGPQPAGQAKLTDFGIARLVDSARLTATGQAMGTATYFSPEQAQGFQISPTSDIYSLGLVLLECLTGKVEFPGPAIASAAARVQRDPQIPSWLGDGWVQVLSAMTHRDPQFRPSAGEVASALRTGPGAGALGDAYGPETESLPASEHTQPFSSAAGTGASDSGYGPPTSQLPVTRPASGGNGNGGSGQGSGSQLYLPDDDEQGPVDVASAGRKRRRERNRPAGSVEADSESETDSAARPGAAGGAGGASGASGAFGAGDATAQTGRDVRSGSDREADRKDDRAGKKRARKKRPGPSTGQWMIVVLSLIAVVIVAGFLIYLLLDIGNAPQPVNFPSVPGDLGNSLEDLQESVKP